MSSNNFSSLKPFAMLVFDIGFKGIEIKVQESLCTLTDIDYAKAYVEQQIEERGLRCCSTYEHIPHEHQSFLGWDEDDDNDEPEVEYPDYYEGCSLDWRCEDPQGNSFYFVIIVRGSTSTP
jgi:hypothetical protein